MLWLLPRPVATAAIRFLAWEPPCAVGAALKRPKKVFFLKILFTFPMFSPSQTRKTASWLAAELSKEGHQVALLSGEMVVEQRAAVIERFREGKEKVLVTTNVCARGEHRLCAVLPGSGSG